MQEHKVTSSVIIAHLRDNPHANEEEKVKVQWQVTAQLQTLKIWTFQGDGGELSLSSEQLPF